MDAQPHQPNPSHLRDDIDSGRTGDKVPGFDPAAAPLGTDEEAAGTPVAPEAVSEAQAHERASGPKVEHPNASQPDLQPNAKAPRTSVAVPILVGAGAAVALVVVLALVVIL